MDPPPPSYQREPFSSASPAPQVHVIHQAPFSFERDKTTAIQLEADMRRTPENGGALSFRAWADGFVVYEARVYASDSAVAGGEKKGMWVEDALIHVHAATACCADGVKEEGKSGPAAAAQHVLIGGVEVWGKRSTCQEMVEVEVEEGKGKGKEKEEEGDAVMLENDSVVPGDDFHMSSLAEKVRFVFVARYRSTKPTLLVFELEATIVLLVVLFCVVLISQVPNDLFSRTRHPSVHSAPSCVVLRETVRSTTARSGGASYSYYLISDTRVTLHTQELPYMMIAPCLLLLFGLRPGLMVKQHGEVRDALSLSTVGHRTWCTTSGSRGHPYPQRARHLAGGGNFSGEELRKAPPQGELHSAIGAEVAPEKRCFAGARRREARRAQRLQAATGLRRDFTPVSEDFFGCRYGDILRMVQIHTT